MVEVKTHKCVARIEHSEQHCLVSLRARMRLNIGKFGTKQFFYALNGEGFYLINHLTSAVIALPG